MKIMSLVKKFEEKHANATLFIGIAIGIGVGMFLFAALVPGSAGLVRMYNTERYEQFGAGGAYMMIQDGRRNGGTIMMRNAFYASATNEKQYLSAMIANQQEAIRLSHQVLSLSGVSKSVTTMAESIIDIETREVNIMKGLLSATSTQSE